MLTLESESKRLKISTFNILNPMFSLVKLNTISSQEVIHLLFSAGLIYKLTRLEKEFSQFSVSRLLLGFFVVGCLNMWLHLNKGLLTVTFYFIILCFLVCALLSFFKLFIL